MNEYSKFTHPWWLSLLDSLPSSFPFSGCLGGDPPARATFLALLASLGVLAPKSTQIEFTFQASQEPRDSSPRTWMILYSTSERFVLQRASLPKFDLKGRNILINPLGRSAPVRAGGTPLIEQSNSPHL